MPGSVLIVEDEHAVRNILSDVLEECGFGVTVASDLGSARALMLADGDEFDFIVLAALLPDGDGLSFCAELRTGPFDRPIIVVSESFEGQSRAALAGASGWIQKPFTISALLEQVEAALLRHCDSIRGGIDEPRFRPISVC
jgi:two-component system response regulator MprA